ncbi:hypothetical protein BHE74_00007280 [Ensete ventricosum]|nr:hypothetical protein BHE74_00007280 [Ensete ventricosum]
MKYVLVTGGVVSGLGKGVTASSIGVLLKACGLRVTAIKIGDIESMPFIEALGPGNFCLVHVSLVPVLDAVAFLLPSNILLDQGADGILVPGGFGDRGVEGKILAVKYARENNVPFLGICLGMQIAIIEFARSVMNFEDANSTEFDPDTTNPCVVFMPEVNPDMITEFEKAGLAFVGKDETRKRMEVCV